MSDTKRDQGGWGNHWDAEFLRGQQACRDGEPETNQGEPYNRGYQAEKDFRETGK